MRNRDQVAVLVFVEPDGAAIFPSLQPWDLGLRTYDFLPPALAHFSI